MLISRRLSPGSLAAISCPLTFPPNLFFKSLISVLFIIVKGLASNLTNRFWTLFSYCQTPKDTRVLGRPGIFKISYGPGPDNNKR